MNKKIISVFICLLFMGMIPVAAGMNNYDNIETESSNTPILSIFIFGIFPNVSENNITFWALVTWTIQKDRFRGHIGNNLIYGIYFISDPY